jgi:polysaccharide export outer membrane protein
MKCPKLPLLATLLALLIAGMPAVRGQQQLLDPSTKVKASESYIIGPLDVIEFRILGEEETHMEVRVSNDGNVALPYIGNIKVAGMTVSDARAAIYKMYAQDYYVNPQIDLAIISYKQKRVNVQGMVNRQGFIVFPPEEKVTLLGAIAMAGGWSDNRLAAKTVKVIRTNTTGTTTTEVDTTKIGPEDYPLMDGDLVIVPERTW